jgi:hypothetical protein
VITFGRALDDHGQLLVANGYLVVARNRDHIKYVTSRELELMTRRERLTTL